MHTPQQIQAFIDSFKEVFPLEIEFTFYNGQCYWFANILAQRFKGEIWFNTRIVHFACLIEGSLWDIYGQVESGNRPVQDEFTEEVNGCWISWEEFQRDHQDAVQSIVDTCIKKIR